jgi:uncharacterized protein (TIGR04222 family)
MLAPSQTVRRKKQMVTDSRANDFLSAVELSPPEAGYLADGAPRAIGATLAALAHMGLIEFRAEDEVVPLKPAPAGLKDPMQRSVLDFLSQSTGPCSVQDIRQHAEPDTEPVRDALRASGLLLDEQALWTGGVAIAGAGLAVFGGILLLAAANEGITAQLVFCGLGITSIPTLLLIGRRRRTRRGSAVLRQLQDEHVALKESAEHAPALLSPTDLSRAVAIYGPTILEGGPLDIVGKALKPERGSCGSCGGGCGGCGGCSGCGGCG